MKILFRSFCHFSFPMLLCLCLFSSCQQQNKAAHALLDAAQEAMNQDRYDEVLTLADSLHRNHPKAIDERKAVEPLRLLAQHKISERNLAYIDSLMPLLETRMQALRGEQLTREFKQGFEEDAIWRYKGYDPSNRGGSYLDVYVKEQDQSLQIISATSTPKQPFKHFALRLLEPKTGKEYRSDTLQYDGGLAYLYRTEDGLQHERLTYFADDAMGMGDLCSTIPDGARLQVELLSAHGTRRFELSDLALKAIKACYQYAAYAKELKEMRRNQELLKAKIEKAQRKEMDEAIKAAP